MRRAVLANAFSQEESCRPTARNRMKATLIVCNECFDKATSVFWVAEGVRGDCLGRVPAIRH